MLYRHVLILIRFVLNFTVFCMFLWISQDFADLPEQKTKATSRVVLPALLPRLTLGSLCLIFFFCHFSHCGAWFQTTMKVKQFMQDHKGKFLPHQHFCNELHPCKPCLLFLSLKGDFLGCLNRPLQNIRQGKSIEQKLNVAKIRVSECLLLTLMNL